MKTRLLWKCLIGYVLVGLACFLLITGLCGKILEKELTVNRSKAMNTEASQLASYYGTQYISNEASYEETLINLKSLASYQEAEIWILNTSGTVLVDSAAESDDELPVLDGFDPVALGSGYYTVGDFFSAFSSKTLTVMVPITGNLSIRGYLAIHVPMSVVLKEMDTLLRQIYIVFTIIFIICLAFLMMVFVWVYVPLRKITKGVKEYAAGNLGYSIPVTSRDEMGYLAETLNYMSDEMNKTNEYQRKFISNVSHDFRSPLTSIKGYTEAIKDGTIPAEMQEKYLGIILFETERLTKLTRSMLTLNTMDAQSYVLDRTDFDLHQVIKTTVATFEGTCTSKKISLELILLEGSLMVNADHDKIQQVLYNLLDNAIKFSKNNSSIQIETSIKRGKIHVTVKDHGIGIETAYLSKIWNRFYKVDASRGKDRTGTGLGLSIVKDIITAHGQKINVVSTVNVGTEFDFTLDAAD